MNTVLVGMLVWIGLMHYNSQIAYCTAQPKGWAWTSQGYITCDRYLKEYK